MASLKKLLRNPAKVVYILDKLGVSKWIPDRPYLKLKYRANFGKKLNLENPQTFNEKLQWLKLYDRKPEYTAMVDKYEAKRYVAERIGEEYIIPTLGIWDRVEDIDFDALPEQFVLKCTHDSGGIVICKDKAKLDMQKARKKIERSLKRNYYMIGREWPYQDVPRRIIAEKYMVDESGRELKDYKIFCFNGESKFIEVDFDRFVGHKRNVYDTCWELTELMIQYPREENRIFDKPKQLEKMMELSEQLSEGVPHLRVDWYICDDKLYFGELTFFHGSGSEKFIPEEWDYTFGSWIKLPEKNKKSGV